MKSEKARRFVVAQRLRHVVIRGLERRNFRENQQSLSAKRLLTPSGYCPLGRPCSRGSQHVAARSWMVSALAVRSERAMPAPQIFTHLFHSATLHCEDEATKKQTSFLLR